MVGRHELRAVEGSQHPRRQHQQDLGARARAERDLGSVARGDREVDDILAILLVQHDSSHVLAAPLDVGRAQHRLDAGLDRVLQLDARLPTPQHLHLVVRAGVVEANLEQESVLLSLGERVRTFVLDRVLSREHDEWRREWKLRALERDASLLHRLQQCGLHLGRSAVDLVREQHVREDGSPPQREGPRGQVKDRCAQYVGGHQVRRELDAAVIEGKRARDGLGEQRLAGAGHALQEHVALRHQRHRAQADCVLLAYHRLGELLAEAVEEVGGGAGRC